MDWSYIAGYFDGEGHVSLHKTSRGDSVRALLWYNTHRGSLEAMRDFMGVGRIEERQHSGFNPGRVIYTLVITKKSELLYALEHLLPNLIVKRDAAIALRDYLNDHVDETRMENFGNVAAISTDQLIKWYHDEGKSFADIAKMLNVSTSAVGQAFRVRGLSTRPAGGGFMKGVPKSEETKRRMKESRRKMWDDPEFRASQLSNLEKGRKKKNGSPTGQ